MADENVNFVSASKIKKNKKRAHPWAFPLGLAIALLAIIGLITVIVAGVGGIEKAVRKSQNIDDYNTMLTPVVMNDPDTFDDISKANMNELMDISIWSILKSNLSPDTYEYSDNGMIIPEADVTAQFKKLFGTEIEPVQATVTGYGYEFVYDAAKKSYIIPITGIEPTYTPDVVDVAKKSNMIVLTVGCLSSEKWAQDSDGKMVAPEPDKYIKVTLRENSDGGYYISALQATSKPETASTLASQTTTKAPETTTVATTAVSTTVAETQALAADTTAAQTAEE